MQMLNQTELIGGSTTMEPFYITPQKKLGSGKKMKRRVYYDFQDLPVGSFFALLNNKDDIFQKVRFISDVTQDHGEKIFKWHTVAVNITSGLGCHLEDNTLTRKIEIVQAVCE